MPLPICLQPDYKPPANPAKWVLRGAIVTTVAVVVFATIALLASHHVIPDFPPSLQNLHHITQLGDVKLGGIGGVGLVGFAISCILLQRNKKNYQQQEDSKFIDYLYKFADKEAQEHQELLTNPFSKKS